MTQPYTLLKGDCLQHMKSIADKSVDLIIADLPFGCLVGGGGQEKATRKEKKTTDVIAGCAWDVKIDLDAFWSEIKRIRKDEHTPCIHFCTTKYGFDLYNSNPKEFRYDLVWDKQRGTSFLTCNKLPMRSHEMIYVFSRAGANYNRIDIEGENIRGKSKASIAIDKSTTVLAASGLRKVTENDGSHKSIVSVIQMSRTYNRNKHPTEKPIDLYKFLIERYSNEGDTVLDPTAGSFNSGLACKELKRKYIGCEMNTDFFNKGVAKMMA